MSGSSDRFRDLDALLAAVCDQTAGPDDIQRIESLAGDDEGIKRVLDYLHIDGLLRWEHGSGVETSDDNFDAETQAEPAAARFDALTPPIIVQTPDMPPSPFFNPQSPFAVGMVSYAAALLIMCVALLGSWAYKINHYQSFVQNRQPPVLKPDVQIVGQITNSKNCVCATGQPQPYVGSATVLGRKYALSSGLLEITYASGAKVILEGPCEYRVDSNVGGHLALGKLTARVEKRSVTREERGMASAKPQAAKSQYIIPNHQSLFTVTTPTAVVTDLGTEFGVEVKANGDTTSHVFRGTVMVQTSDGASSAESPSAQSTVLHANESAKVEKRKGTNETHIVTGSDIASPSNFVRRLRQPPKYIGLLDIVAGGNGKGKRRERGIDPASGLEDPTFVPHYRTNGRQYRLVFWHRLIDGVFVPDGRGGDVQIDSSGHKFSGFPATSGEAFGSIWSRAADIGSKRVNTAQPWVYSIIGDKKHMPKGSGLLGIYANGGITFDLKAIGEMYAEVIPSRFTATVGLADGPRKDPGASGMADVWVFVDGRLKLKREKIKVRNGTFPIDVELKSGDRFLTLAVTDGGNGVSWDGVVFGDPMLKMTSLNNDVPRTNGGKEGKEK